MTCYNQRGKTMKLCERCPQSATCLLDYMGNCCKELRKKNCPGVRLNNYERVTQMSKEELAEFISEATHGNEVSTTEAEWWLERTVEEV